METNLPPVFFGFRFLLLFSPILPFVPTPIPYPFPSTSSVSRLPLFVVRLSRVPSRCRKFRDIAGFHIRAHRLVAAICSALGVCRLSQTQKPETETLRSLCFVLMVAFFCFCFLRRRFWLRSKPPSAKLGSLKKKKSIPLQKYTKARTIYIPAITVRIPRR